MAGELTALTSHHIEAATSFADGIYRIMRETGLDKDRVEEMLLDANVEQCPSPEAGELVDENSEPDGYCGNCRGYDKPKAED